jgi:hypothetical protein
MGEEEDVITWVATSEAGSCERSHSGPVAKSGPCRSGRILDEKSRVGVVRDACEDGVGEVNQSPLWEEAEWEIREMEGSEGKLDVSREDCDGVACEDDMPGGDGASGAQFLGQSSLTCPSR